MIDKLLADARWKQNEFTFNIGQLMRKLDGRQYRLDIETLNDNTVHVMLILRDVAHDDCMQLNFLGLEVITTYV